MRRHFPVLFRHFLRQFASFESISPSGEATSAVIAIVSLLAAPGYLVAVLTARGALRMTLANAGRFPPENWLWRQEWLLLTVSFSAVAVLVAVQWEAFLLGGRDRRILGLLPVGRVTVARAKLASVVAIVLLVHLALNALPGLILPMASPFGYLRPALGLQAALLLQTVLVCASVVAVHGIAGLVLPRRLLPRVSSLLQSAILLLAVGLVVWSGALSRFAFAVRDDSHWLNAVLPLVWFRSLYLRLAGVASPSLTAHAVYGLAVTTVAGLAATGVCLLGDRDAGDAVPLRREQWWERIQVPRRLARIARALRARFPRRGSPVSRAAASFARRAVVASPPAVLITRGWLALGLALTLGGLGAFWHHGSDVSLVPRAALYAPAIVLPFFALVGLRSAAVVPATIEANWIFRLTETPRSVDYAAAVRAAAMRIAVWPVLAVLAVPYLVLWGPLRTAAYLALAVGVAAVTVEWLFLGFSKVPFTCTYQPGKANLRLSWPRHAAVFFLYCCLLPPAARWLLGHPTVWVMALALLVAARETLVRAGERSLARSGRLVFEDEAPAFLTHLALDR